MSGFTYGNGIIHTLTQNTRELPLRSLDQKPGQSAILDDTYTYDANANVAAIADGTAGNADSRTMAYDGLDRLTTTNAPHQWWISAATTYDALDNIRANQVGNTATYLNTFSYDPTTWHLTAIAGHVNWALSYDANGNVTSKGTGNDSYAFDAANRLTSVAGKESYRYDGYGRRVKITRSADGKIDYPVYDRGGQLLTEDDQRSNPTTDYVSLNGSLVAKRASAIGKNQWTTTWEHTDALRSPRLETSASGALTRAELYTPYGEPSDGKYVQGPGYTGHVTDAATHLTYAQQRYYDPGLGRFLSVDPVEAGGNGGSFNRYWYANNNPYKFTDVDGRLAGDPSIDPVDAAMNSSSATLRQDGTPFKSPQTEGTSGVPSTGAETERAALRTGAGIEEGIVTVAAPEAELEGAGAKMLFRRGPFDSAKTLAKQAGEAEKAIGVHGVSVSTNPAARKAGQVVRSALQKDVERAGLKVTQTGKDLDHHTIELPKTITKEFEKVWNALFK